MSAASNDDDHPTVIRTGDAAARTAQQTHAQTLQQTHAPTVQTGRATHGPSDDTLALPIGTRIGEFELTRRVGEGGFGIVYQAWDHTLERKVAVKEYLPASIATRVGATRISCRSDRHRETFEAGLKSFINEAKLLARFDHPSMVKVFRFWEANGTAYMVMPFYEGTTLRDSVRAMAAPPGEAWLRQMLGAVTEALAVLHAEQCYHRDIAPDNVMLLEGSERPLLLDFGAARRVIGDMTQALTVILKPGYAPVEQYAEVPGMKQGPWTDVYALAAVVYWCVTGKTPPPSVGRMLSDSWVPLSEAAAGRYSEPFLAAIDRALAVRPEQRTQTIELLRAELGLAGAMAPAPAAPVRTVDPDATVIRPARTLAGTAATQAPPKASPTLAPAPSTQRPASTVAREGAPAPAPTHAAAPDSAARVRPNGALIGAGVAGLLLIGAGVWWGTRPAAPSAPLPAPTAAAPAPAPPQPPAPTAMPAPEPAPPVAAAAPPPAPPPAPPARAVPRSADEAIAQWLAERNPAVQLTLRAPSSAAVSGREALKIGLSSNRAGYLYLVAQRTGTNELVLWHPASSDARVRVEANARRDVAPAAWAAQAPAPGAWRVTALVTREPWDLAAAGWTARGGALQRSFADGAAPVAALGLCPADRAGCANDFGAETFNVELSAPRPRPSAPPPAAAPPDAAANNANAAECARIIAQMSLGETSAALSARFKALGCR